MEKALCNNCITSLPYTNEQPSTNFMANQLRALQPITGVYAMLYQNPKGNVAQIIHQLKYRGRKDIGKVLGKQLGEKILSYASDFDVVIPVPLHPIKEKKRGFNQSQIIAEATAETLKLPLLNNVLIRQVNTVTQTRKTRIERFKAMRNVFTVKNKDAIRSKNVLLIDDVLTTGATEINCAETLLHAGANSVFLTALAKADLF